MKGCERRGNSKVANLPHLKDRKSREILQNTKPEIQLHTPANLANAANRGNVPVGHIQNGFGFDLLKA